MTCDLKMRSLCASVAALGAVLSAAQPASAAAPSFYISSSNPAASDSNPGTSPSAPWKTLARASQSASVLSPGSSLLLRGGDVFTLSSAIDGGWTITGLRGGSFSDPSTLITIGAYFDSGSMPDRPLIYRPAPAAGPAVRIDNSSGVVVQGLEVAGGETGVAYTWDTVNGNPTTYDSVGVVDCYFRDILGLAYNGTSGSWWAPAVGLTAAHAGVTVTNAVYTNSLVNASDVVYQNSVPWEPGMWTRAFVQGLDLSSNTFTHISFNSVFLDTTSHVSVASNVFLNNTPAQLFQYGTTDIILGSLDETCSITGNEISWRGEYQPGGPDGCAIDFETSAHGMVVADNYIAHSFGAGIMVFGHQTTSTNLTFSGNTFVQNGCLQTRSDHGGIAFMHLNSSGVIESNTFVPCADNNPPVFYPLEPGAMDGWTIQNNVIGGQNGTVHVIDPPVVSWTFDAAKQAIVVTAAPPATYPFAVLRYTTDGSRPRETAQEWPATGTLTLPARAVAVNVKAFPSGPPPPGNTVIESTTAGGIMAPPARGA
jgi:hypothetical protein